jgi:hypothetical protein
LSPAVPAEYRGLVRRADGFAIVGFAALLAGCVGDAVVARPQLKPGGTFEVVERAGIDTDLTLQFARLNFCDVDAFWE